MTFSNYFCGHKLSKGWAFSHGLGCEIESIVLIGFNLLKFSASITNLQKFVAFQVNVKPARTLTCVPETAKASCALCDIGISGARFGGYSWKCTLLPYQQLEDLKIYQSANLPPILVYHGSCGMLSYLFSFWYTFIMKYSI